MQNKTLLVKCKRGDLGTDYAYFVVGRWDGEHFYTLPDSCGFLVNAVQITYLELRDYVLVQKEVEALPFEEYEEAALLHDGNGWILSEVAAWVKGLEVQGDLNAENETRRCVTDEARARSVSPAPVTEN